MLIRVEYSTRYDYERAPHFVVQVLRKTPRSCESQHVRRWAIESDVDARIRQSEDAFGNIVHTLYSEKPVDTMTISVFGEVDTSDTGGVLQGWPERQHALVYLRTTPLTAADEAIRDFASGFGGENGLEQLHALMNAINDRIGFDTGATGVSHTAEKAFALGRGVCQDHAHIFLAAARWLGVPSRYVSGHLRRSDGQVEQEAAHAWVEALVDGLGWVGFDPANGLCPDENYVRVASGLDYLGASPVRGSSYGGMGESMSVQLRVHSHPQSQHQQ
ncbi:MAG: Protein containing transglutaminase-like domain, putative cysteine protease [Oceanicaulis sp. HLUCCA04]|nr:MAG: Protein containing transglutaminase-like domain, putative cysteine protease [Oceanicaulis sp. HLUCCA04]